MMMEARKEELAEAREKNMQEKSIVIRGKDESEDNDDEIFTEKLIKQLAVEKIKIKSFKIIGIKSVQKRRPIIVQFHSISDKEKVRSNLKNLKDVHLTDSQFCGLSITDDYTRAEREMIKVFQQKAILKNETSPGKEYVYKTCCF